MEGRLDWHPEQLLARVKADLAANADLVGKFVETEARRRLLDLDDLRVELPDRRAYYGGAAYRKYVAGLLGYEVEALDNQVEIRVGVREGRSGKRHGLHIELGTPLFAPRPFLRPAVLENAEKITQLLANR